VNTHAIAAALGHSLTGRRGTKLLLCAAGAVAIASTALGSPAAAISNVTGTGTTTCTTGWNGTMTFHPALKTGGIAHQEEVGLTVAFNGCTGGTPTPTSGRYAGKGIVSGAGANNCANWFAAPLATPPLVTFNTAHLDGDVAWTPGTINSSNVSFTSLRIWTGAADRLLIKLPSPAAASLVTGSYAPTADLAIRALQLQPAVLASCGSSAGLSSLTIVPANPSNLHSHGSW
jgi:hypothetical protein